MPRIMHIAFTVYPVTDMARTRNFYEMELGLTATNEYKDFWVEYILGGACFALMDSAKMKADVVPSSSAGGSLAFEVDDLDGFLKQLKSHGVKTKTDVIDSGGCRQVYILDPSGNAVGLHQKSADRK